MRLSYSYECGGLFKSRDVRSTKDVLLQRDYTVLDLKSDNVTIYIKDRDCNNNEISETRCYVSIISMSETYLVGIDPYNIGKDNIGVKHYSYTENLLHFMKEYGGTLPVFKLIVDKLR